MICEVYGCEEVGVRHLTRSYGKGPNLLVIENVPVVSCPRCGESYMTAETMHELDRIRSNRGALAGFRPVAVATY